MGTAAGKGVSVWYSVSEGVRFGDGRGGADTYVVSVSKGVGGVREATEMATSEGDSRQLAEVQAAASGTVAARAMAAGGIK